MKSARFLTLPALVLCVAACSSIVPTSGPKLPADWKNAAGFPVTSASKDLSRWWTRFGDSTLNRLISTAIQDSPDIASASARIRESRARRDSTGTGLFPTLTGSAGLDTNATSRNDISDRGKSISTGLSASWELDLFGKQRSAIQAASANLGATEENYNSVQASLASEMAIAYVNLRSAETRLDVLHRSLKSREETYSLAKFRLQAGTIDTLESDQAFTSLQQARAAIPALEQTISQTKNLINLIAGKNPGMLDGMLASGRRAIPAPPSSLAIGIPADTLRQRPDVRVAGYQLLAAAATTRSVNAERFPSLSLSGSLGLNTISSGKLFNPETATASLGGGIFSPIFDAGRIKANIEAQKAVEEQTVQTYRSVVLSALSETEDALIACRRTAERQSSLQLAENTARAAAETAAQRYEAGVTDILTVLDSQRTLLSIDESLVNLQADRTIAYIQLYKALGGGWSR